MYQTISDFEDPNGFDQRATNVQKKDGLKSKIYQQLLKVTQTPSTYNLTKLTTHLCARTSAYAYATVKRRRFNAKFKNVPPKIF